MSLLNDILGAVLGGNTGGSQQNAIGQIVAQLLKGSGQPGQDGGIGALIQQFQKAGLGDAVNSWVSTGQNQPVNGAQVQQALGSDRIQQFAQQTGMQGGQVSDLLAQILPQFVDKVTPNGSVPQQNDLQGMLSQLLGGGGR